MTLHVLVPFDGSQVSRDVLSWAATLQRARHGLSIHAVSIVEPRTNGLGILESMLAQTVRDTGAEASCEILESITPGQAIVAAAARLGSDLILLGRTPQGAKDTEYVRSHASCLVVTFPGEEVNRAGCRPSA